MILRSISLCCLIGLILSLLTGCWDRVEIEKRAVILALAIDLADPQHDQDEEISHVNGQFPEPSEPMIRLTAQIAVPGRLSLGPSEGGASDKKPVWILSVAGHTVNDAMTVLQQELADRIFLGHLRVIVISEQVARSGVHNLNEYFRRNPKVRRQCWMVVSNGRADVLMNAAPELERVPAFYLLAMLDHAVDQGKYPRDVAGVFWNRSSSKGREGQMPYVKIKKKENIDIAGLAYFRNDKLVGIAEPLEIGFYMALTGTKKGGYSVFAPNGEGRNYIMFRAFERKMTSRVKIKDGVPHIHLHIQIEGNIEETTGKRPVLDQQTLRSLEQNLAERAKEQCMKLIQDTQTKGSDIFGFGEQVRAKQPDYWNREIGSKERWQDMYPRIQVSIDYDTRIRRVGMKAQ